MPKSVACMTPSEINKALDRADHARSKVNDKFIAAGRGHERPSETVTKSDPLAQEWKRTIETGDELRREISRRYGPGAPRRLPRGFGPIGGRC